MKKKGVFVQYNVLYAKIDVYNLAGISLYVKFCEACRTPFRYQEYMDGVHNFNDNWLLSLGVCDMIRKHIQVHCMVVMVYCE